MESSREITQTYTELIKWTSIPIFTTTESGRFVEVNQAFIEILEYSWEELKELKATNLFEDSSERSMFQELLAQDGKYNDKLLRLKTKSGTIRYFLESAVQITKELNNKQEIFYQGFLFDITDQIHAEDQLHLLNRGLEQAPISILLWNSNNEIEYVNPKFCELSGYNQSDIIGQSPHILNDDLHDGSEHFVIRSDIAKGKVWQGMFRNQREDGTRYTVDTTIVPIRNRVNKITHYMGIQQDVSQQIRQKQIIEEKEIRFKMLFDNAQVGIILSNQKENIIDVNDYFLNMVGYERYELFGKDYRLFTHEADFELTKNLLKQVNKGNSISNVEKRYVTKSGEVIWGSVSMSITKIDGLKHYIISVLNITAKKNAEKRQKEMEQSLLQATKFEAIGRLSGNIAHDFNNLLTIIMNNNELIRLLNDNREISKYIEDIERASKHGAHIIANLLKYSRKSPAKKEVLEMHNIITEVIEMLVSLSGPNIDIFSDLSEEKAIIIGNNSDLSSAIMNIGLNAIEAMEEQGGELRFSTEVKDNLVRLIICDTGGGIPEETIELIFDPFFSTKEDGTGLGLSSAQGIIKDHSGSIAVSSKNGGTEFIITIPLWKSKNIVVGNYSAKDKNLDAIPLRMLVVDDEKSILTSFNEYFTKKNYQVNYFDVAKNAISFYEENFLDIDLVILDMQLSSSNTGLFTMKAMKEINPNVKIIFYSGYLEVDSDIVNDETVLAVLTKPMDLGNLEIKIQELYHLIKS